MLYILFILLLLTSCGSPKIERVFDENDPYSAMEDWQIKYVEEKEDITSENIELYMSQKDLINTFIHYGIDENYEETQEDAKFLDYYHEFLGDWYIMRSNLAVLTTEKIDKSQYKMVLITGFGGNTFIELVKYTNRINSYKINREKRFFQEVNYNSVPVVISLNLKNNIFYGVKKTEYTDEILNDSFSTSEMSILTIKSQDNKEIKVNINSLNAFIIEYPYDFQPSGYEVIDKNGKIVFESNIFYQ